MSLSPRWTHAKLCLSRLVPTVPAPGRGGLWKTHSMLEHTLILELDGTLVCSSMLAGQWWGAGATFTTTFQGDAYEVHVKLHPHQILESLSKIYEIFIFTTVKQDYAEKVLDVLDPKKKLIRYCFSQRDCLCARGFYWKDLTCLGRDLAKTVALDHTIQSFPAQILAALALVGGAICVPQTPRDHDGSSTASAALLSPQAANWIPVPRWGGDSCDKELLCLIVLLGRLGWVVRTMQLGTGRGQVPGVPGQGDVRSSRPLSGQSPHLSPCRSMQDDVCTESQRRFPHHRLPTEDWASMDEGERDGETPMEGLVGLTMPWGKPCSSASKALTRPAALGGWCFGKAEAPRSLPWCLQPRSALLPRL
ncbi:uncharacterized protein VSU04_014843 isoform 2-T2 [Chlamydotis macqueenii]